MMRFEVKAYRRSFRREFANAHGVIPSREGAIVRIEDDDGRFGFGEIAPLVDFGTESLVSALAMCSRLEDGFHPEASREIWKDTHCLAHAVTGALEMMQWSALEAIEEIKPAWPVCGLLSGSEYEREFEELKEFGYRSVKVKIGIDGFELESRKVARLAERSDGALGIRLDANGGLSLKETIEWLELSADLGIEFFEQPLPRGEEETMLKLTDDYPTAIALDESVVTPDDLKRLMDWHWQGLFVIKPLIAGELGLLKAELAKIDAERLVFSSSLESVFGAATGLRLALEFRSEKSLALGFGADRLFANDNFGFKTAPFLQTGMLPPINDLSELWNQI